MTRLGRYELGAVLGEGGDGVVYRATLHGPGGLLKPVAVKVLHQGAESLRREARIGGLLRHRNLVDVYEIGEQDGQWFCAMELCDASLLDRIPLPPRAVVEVGLQVCAALRYAHTELDLVHLDLKPANLLVSGGVVKVADLGIARAAGFDGDDKIRGTLGYMAPEVARGEPVDARADVYALGMTLIRLATGRGPEVEETVDLDLEEWPTLIAPYEGEWLAPVVDRCLRTERTERWPDMAAMAEALRELTVEGEGLRAFLGEVDPPAIYTRSETNVPERTDAFVGREREITQLQVALQAPLSLTLKGPAGIGKSRLAVEAARAWRERTAGQVWLCDLSEARSEEGFLAVVARVLDVPLRKGDMVAQLGRALGSRGEVVLVLDNFEHIAHVGHVVDQWRRLATDARILVTSRTRLGLPDEQVMEVGPLPSDAAVALLEARARQRGADVAGDEGLNELAERLDGLPLALELAAGRLGVLSVADVLARLSLSLLRQSTDDRHATLKAALDWSWELLESPARSALAQLSVFEGGFTLEAAEAVIALDAASVLDALEALDGASLLRVDGERFRLLSSVQEYAGGQLKGGGSDAEIRHGRWFARFGSRTALDALDRHGGTELRRALAADIDNIFAACDRAQLRSDADVATGTAVAATAVVELTGPYGRAIDALERALEMEGLDTAFEARIRGALGSTLQWSGRMQEAQEQLDLAVRAYQDLGDDRSSSGLLRALGVLHRYLGDLDRAEALFDESVAWAVRSRDRKAEGIAWGNKAIIYADRLDLQQAAACYERAIEIHREVGNRRSEGIVLGNLGVLHSLQSRTDEARACLEPALQAHRFVGDRRFEGVVLASLALLEWDDGRPQEALAAIRDALVVHREVGNRRSEGFTLTNIGDLLLDMGEAVEARSHLGQALRINEELGDPFMVAYIQSRVARLDIADGHVERAMALLDLAEPVIRGVSDPAALAMLLAIRAEGLAAGGRSAEAQAMLGEARHLAPDDHPDATREIERVAVRISPSR